MSSLSPLTLAYDGSNASGINRDMFSVAKGCPAGYCFIKGYIKQDVSQVFKTDSETLIYNICTASCDHLQASPQ